MGGNEFVALRFEAFALGMKARVNGVDAEDVEELRQRAEQLIDDADDPVRRAITEFATQYELCAHDFARLSELGDDLTGRIERANYAPPPGSDRKDTHG